MHAPVVKGTGPGTSRAPVITWDFMNSVDSASQNIIRQGVNNWDAALRKETGTNTPWLVKGSQGSTPGILFNIGRLNGPAGLAGDNCVFTRVRCGHGQRITLNSDWWYGRANDEQKLGVVSHELGHTLGLGHATGGREHVPGNPDEVMRPTIAFRGAPGTPSAHETATVAKIYGQSSKGPTVSDTSKQGGPTVQQPPTKQDGPTVQPPQPRTQEGGWQGEWRRNSQGQWEGHWARQGWQGDWKLVDGKWQGQWTPTAKEQQTQGQQEEQRGGQPPAQQAAAWAGQSNEPQPGQDIAHQGLQQTGWEHGQQQVSQPQQGWAQQAQPVQGDWQAAAGGMYAGGGY